MRADTDYWKALAAELLGEEGLANVSISGQQVVAGIEGMQIKTLQVCSKFRRVCLIWKRDG